MSGLKAVLCGIAIVVAGSFTGISLAWLTDSKSSLTQSNPYYAYNPFTLNGGKVTVSPWTDPDTGCRYLITTMQNGNGGARMTARLGQYGAHWCPPSNRK